MTDVTIPPGDLPGTLDPIELALEAEAAQPSPDTPAALVLRRHASLLQRQIASETVGLGLKALAGAAALAVAGLLGMLVWDASTERGLVVEPFSVPPEFAERGYTGQVVASQVLDRLSEMQDATGSSRAPSTYANNWNGDIKVQIPETGVSVGELRRLLVQWLGHQTAISGELYRAPDGRLALAARTGAAAAKTHQGTDAELDALVKAAAEDVYAVTQPYRYAAWLMNKGDPDSMRRSKALLQQLAQTGDHEDRVWAYAALNLILQNEGDYPGAVRAASAAIALEPDFNLAWANRAGAQLQVGHDEAALADARVALETARKHGERFMRPAALAYVLPNWEGVVADLTGDCDTSVRAYAEAMRQPGQEGYRAALVSAQAACHDLAGARAARAEAPAPTPQA
ncbi:hypothetical protein, partial [Caulobacter sp. 17J65-9]|uniref:tetratricopeptide repeat protein n=1 Tax=Caulobacter sp. 17J65-9 TaxID=2709382 RepID=UPI0013C8DC0B